ncbi:unnamed protein product, partial [Notodromas monacha]
MRNRFAERSLILFACLVISADLYWNWISSFFHQDKQICSVKISLKFTGNEMLTRVANESEVKHEQEKPLPGNHVILGGFLYPATSVQMKTGQIFFIDFTDSSPAAAAAETPLAKRKLCAIESAARLHPKNIIYLVTNSVKIKLSKALRILIRTYSNVRFIIFDSDPFSAFGIDPESDSKNLHAAELARYSLLLSHGGIYLDLDQIVVKPIIGKFIRNTLGRQFDDEGNILLSGHVMAFPPGHDFLEQVMLQAPSSYSSTDNSSLGSSLLNKIYNSENFNKTSIEIPAELTFDYLNKTNVRNAFSEDDGIKMKAKTEKG